MRLRRAATRRGQDRAGFIVDALLIPYILSAVRMLESGFATAEDIDEGIVRSAAHRMGPLALADLIGLDTRRHPDQRRYEPASHRRQVRLQSGEKRQGAATNRDLHSI